jgi:nickel transport protein
MIRKTIASLVFLAALLCLTPVCHAHRVNIFAYVDGDSVVTESGYSRTSRVHDGTVEVFDAATGLLLLSGTTDQEGRFAFAIPAPARTGTMDLRLLLTAGTGHQAEWLVTGEELAAFGAAAGQSGIETPAGATAETDQSEVQPATQPGTTAQAAASSSADPAAVEAMLRRELAPIKHMLAELNQTGPGVTEILGGIGYIFGLFGVAAYMKSRTRPKDRS